MSITSIRADKLPCMEHGIHMAKYQVFLVLFRAEIGTLMQFLELIEWYESVLTRLIAENISYGFLSIVSVNSGLFF